MEYVTIEVPEIYTLVFNTYNNFLNCGQPDHTNNKRITICMIDILLLCFSAAHLIVELFPS